MFKEISTIVYSMENNNEEIKLTPQLTALQRAKKSIMKK